MNASEVATHIRAVGARNASPEVVSWLKTAYLESDDNKALANALGVNPTTLYRWLKRMGISSKGVTKARKRMWRDAYAGKESGLHVNRAELADDVKEFLIGSVLGDGHLEQTSRYSARYVLSNKHLEYIEWVRALLRQGGFESSFKQQHSDIGAWWHLKTRSYPSLLPLRKWLYPNGRRIIPKELELTPVILKQWYIGDGNLEYWGEHPAAILSTCAFASEQVIGLASRLTQMGFQATHRPSNNTVRVSIHATPGFLEYLGECPVKCYQYKWGS